MKTIEKHRRRFGKEMFKRYVKNLWVYLPCFVAIPVLKISFGMAMFIAGFTGVFVILKKEVPSGMFPIRGSAAIVMGIILIILFWGLAVSMFWF